MFIWCKLLYPLNLGTYTLLDKDKPGIRINSCAPSATYNMSLWSLLVWGMYRLKCVEDFIGQNACYLALHSFSFTARLFIPKGMTINFLPFICDSDMNRWPLRMVTISTSCKVYPDLDPET
jgi:hypothetical protein